MALGVDSILRERFRRTRWILVALSVGASLLASAGGAYAQTGDGGSSVDQYVEDVPSAGGKVHPGVGSPHTTTLPSSLGNQISSQGASDASTLRDLMTKSDYGGMPASGESSSSIDPEADVYASSALSSAVSSVQGGEAGRLVGLLIVLFAISLATLTAVGLRERRRMRQAATLRGGSS
jgi:hypothetical protein